MTNFDDVRNRAEKSIDYMREEGNASLQKGVKEVKQSGRDWWQYVEAHPLQSMLFGIVGYFAVKGFFKN